MPPTLSRNAGCWAMRNILSQVQQDGKFTVLDPDLQKVINQSLTDLPMTDISPADKQEAKTYLEHHGIRSVAA